MGMGWAGFMMAAKEKEKNRPQEEQEVDLGLVPRQPLGRASASPCRDAHLPPFLPIDFFISVVFKLCESNQILVKKSLFPWSWGEKWFEPLPSYCIISTYSYLWPLLTLCQHAFSHWIRVAGKWVKLAESKRRRKQGVAGIVANWKVHAPSKGRNLLQLQLIVAMRPAAGSMSGLPDFQGKLKIHSFTWSFLIFAC